MCQVFDLGDHSGRTQCTRLRTSGEPNRFVRGGATSSGISEVASGCRRCQSRRASHGQCQPRRARHKQRLFKIVMCEQQRSEPRTRAFAVALRFWHLMSLTP
jgi:hypothetical protein